MKKIGLWLLIMIGYIGAVWYPFYELNRVIHAYIDKYGAWTWATGKLTWQQELTVIWLGFSLGIILVGILASVVVDYILGKEKV